jgi:hypothetical protein
MSLCPTCARPRVDEDPTDPACAACRGELGGRALRDARRAWLYDAAFRALELARVYRAEEGAGGERERGCLAEVARLRALLAEGRRARVDGPGLAKGPTEPAAAATAKRSG